MPGTPLEDMELVGRAREGDAAAFEELVRRYQDRVYNVAFRLVGNAEDAADAAQEAFMAAYQGLGGFRAESALYTWLYRIVVNKALNQRRLRMTRREFVPGDDPSPLETAVAHVPGPHEAAERKERAALVQKAICGLPEDLRAVVVLRDIEGLQYEEMAEVLEIALGTVKSRLHRARMALRETLGRYLEVTP